MPPTGLALSPAEGCRVTPLVILSAAKDLLLSFLLSSFILCVLRGESGSRALAGPRRKQVVSTNVLNYTCLRFANSALGTKHSVLKAR